MRHQDRIFHCDDEVSQDSSNQSGFKEWAQVQQGKRLHESFTRNPRKHGTRFQTSKNQSSFNSEGYYSTETRRVKNFGDRPGFYHKSGSIYKDRSLYDPEAGRKYVQRSRHCPSNMSYTNFNPSIEGFDERSVTEKSGSSKSRIDSSSRSMAVDSSSSRSRAKSTMSSAKSTKSGNGPKIQQYDINHMQPRYRQRLHIESPVSEERRLVADSPGTVLFQSIPNLSEMSSSTMIRSSLEEGEAHPILEVDDNATNTTTSSGSFTNLFKSWSNDECSTNGSVLGGGTALCEQVSRMRHHIKSLKDILVEKYHNVKYAEIRVTELRKDLISLDSLRIEAAKPLQKEYGMKKSVISINDFFDFYTSKFSASSSNAPSTKVIALKKYREINQNIDTVKSDLIRAETEAKVVHVSVKKLKRDILGIEKCLKQIEKDRSSTIEIYERDCLAIKKKKEELDSLAGRKDLQSLKLEEAENNVKRKDTLISRYESEVASLKKEMIVREEDTERQLAQMQEELQMKLEQKEKEAVKKLKKLEDKMTSMKAEHGQALAMKDKTINELMDRNEAIQKKAEEEKKEYMLKVQTANEQIYSKLGAARDAAQAELVFSFQRLAMINDMFDSAKTIHQDAEIVLSQNPVEDEDSSSKDSNSIDESCYSSRSSIVIGKKEKKKMKKKSLYNISKIIEKTQ